MRPLPEDLSIAHHARKSTLCRGRQLRDFVQKEDAGMGPRQGARAGERFERIPASRSDTKQRSFDLLRAPGARQHDKRMRTPRTSLVKCPGNGLNVETSLRDHQGSPLVECRLFELRPAILNLLRQAAEFWR